MPDHTIKKYAPALLAMTLLASLLWGFAQRADAAVYYAAGSKVGRVNLDGTGANPSFINTSPSQVAGVAVNEEYVYWTSISAGTVSRAKLDGSGKETVVTGAKEPQAVAVGGEYVYWTNGGTVNTIGRAKLDGSEANQSFITGAKLPNGIAVDAEHVYWTNSKGNTIGRANIDGSEPNQSFITGANQPIGVAVDAEHIYWANFAESTGETIGRANLAGGEKNQSFITGAEGPRSVAVDAAHLYWSNFGIFGNGNTYGRANIDGSAADQEFITTVSISQPFGIAVDARRTAATTVSCEPGYAGQATTCTAKVTDTESGTPGQPTGVVTFSTTGAGTFGGGGTCTLAAAGTGVSECPVSYTPSAVGTETITASYGGGPTAESGSGTTELAVAIPASPTKTTIVCTPNPVFPKVEVSCVTTVVDTSASPTAPVGEVGFTTDKNGTLLDGPSCALAAEGADRAGCRIRYISTVFGQHLITAKYKGSSTQNPSTGIVALEVQLVHKSTSALSCATDPPVLATVPTACTVTVFDKGFPPGPPTGVVSFASDGGGEFAPSTCVPVPVAKDSASCTIAYTPSTQGIVGLSSTFEGPPGFEPSRASTGLKVGLAPAKPQPLQCQPGFQAGGDPPVCREPAKTTPVEAPRPKGFSRGRPTIDRKNGTATLSVYLPGPGRAVVGGAGVAKVTNTVTAAGPVKFTVKATGSAARTLRKNGHVTVQVKVTYTPPPGGKPETMKFPVRLVLAAKNKESH